jgi:hypothetical protein
VYCALRGAGPKANIKANIKANTTANISTLFGQTAGQMPHCRPFRGRIAATITNSARQMIASRAGNDGMTTTNARHEPRDERCGTW